MRQGGGGPGVIVEALLAGAGLVAIWRLWGDAGVWASANFSVLLGSWAGIFGNILLGAAAVFALGFILRAASRIAQISPPVKVPPAAEKPLRQEELAVAIGTQPDPLPATEESMGSLTPDAGKKIIIFPASAVSTGTQSPANFPGLSRLVQDAAKALGIAPASVQKIVTREKAADGDLAEALKRLLGRYKGKTVQNAAGVLTSFLRAVVQERQGAAGELPLDQVDEVYREIAADLGVPGRAIDKNKPLTRKGFGDWQMEVTAFRTSQVARSPTEPDRDAPHQGQNQGGHRQKQ